MGVSSGMGFMGFSPGRRLLRQVPGLSAEAASASVGLPERFHGYGFAHLLVEAFVQDNLYGSVPGVVIVQSPFAGGLQAFFPEPFAQRDDALRSPQVIEHPVSEEDLYECLAVDSDPAGLFEAPLGVLRLVGDGLRGKMLVYGGAKPCSFQPGIT